MPGSKEVITTFGNSIAVCVFPPFGVGNVGWCLQYVHKHYCLLETHKAATVAASCELSHEEGYPAYLRSPSLPEGKAIITPPS